jgi:peptide/nickel transport system substrate-binding protein
MLLALAKISTPCCFVMPARIAATDPFKQISEYVGSGPMRFARDEWLPGARAAFEKFPDYLPRQEPASWMAGGKRVAADRIEWLVMPDAATASAALQNGEVDWWELVIPDVVPLLRKNRNVVVDISDSLGWIGLLLMNHLYPPFNDVRARRAILMAMSQQDYMRAYVGDDDSLWKPLPGYFTPGTPLYSEEGGEILKGPRNLDAARRLLEESGYAGQPVTCMAAQDLPHHKAWGDVTVDLLTHLGVKVDYVAVDWGTVVARRAQKAPPAQGGWQMFHTSTAGVSSVDASNLWIRADGSLAVNGWANSPPVEAEVAAWFDAKTVEEEKAVARRLNKAALDYVVYAPLGFYLRYFAWRKNITGAARLFEPSADTRLAWPCTECNLADQFRHRRDCPTVGKDPRRQDAFLDAQVILEHALEHGAQVSRGPQIARFVEIGLPEPGPIGDHTAAFERAAGEQRHGRGAVVGAVVTVDARGTTEFGDQRHHSLAPRLAHVRLNRRNRAVERAQQS